MSSAHVYFYEPHSHSCSYFQGFATHRFPYREPGDFRTWEIFHRHVFTSISPHCEASGKLDHDLVLAAGTVSHVTHNDGERGITKDFDDFYTFKPRAKYGRILESCCEAYVDTFLTPDMTEFRLTSGVEQQYKFVGPDESFLLNGHYSWWGINTVKWVENVKDTESIKAVVSPSSIFGNVAFSCTLENLLIFYQASRQLQMEEKKPDLYFLVGGTLRYSQEVACLIIVCTESDRHSEALKDYQPLKFPILDNGIDPAFFPNGLVDENGKIVDLSCASKAEFRPRYMSEYPTWSLLTFALYYNNAEDKLKCSRDRMLKEHISGHADDFCIRKMKITTESGIKWMCPNNV